MNINDKTISGNGRLKFNIPKSKLERVLGIVYLLVTIIMWVYLIATWNDLPLKIPKHFGISGKPDSWGGRGSLLMLPIIQTIFYVFFIVLSKIPQYYNYVVTITEENAARQYLSSRMLLTFVFTEISVAFLFLQWQSVQVAFSRANGLGIWFLPVFLTVLFVTIGISIYRMVKLK